MRRVIARVTITDIWDDEDADLGHLTDQELIEWARESLRNTLAGGDTNIAEAWGDDIEVDIEFEPDEDVE